MYCAHGFKVAESMDRHFFRRKHADDDMTHTQKMLNITNDETNANQNQNEILSTRSYQKTNAKI